MLTRGRSDADALIRCFAGTLIRWCAGKLVLIDATCTAVFHIRTGFECGTHNFSHMSSKRYTRKAFRERHQKGTTNSEEE